ncbi:MAG: hypothetical protein AB7N76_14105 [Planctomycetota bacterium]
MSAPLKCSLSARGSRALSASCAGCAAPAPLVACARCGTVQHRECFQSLGCTTLGCRGLGCRGLPAAPTRRVRLEAPSPGPRSRARRRWLAVLAALPALFLLLGACLHLAYWNPTLERLGEEVRGIGALRHLAQVQGIFHEQDRERDGRHDYARLQELIDALLLGRHDEHGPLVGKYELQCAPGALDPEGTWWAIARPLDPTWRGRSFFTNHSGVIYESSEPIGFADVRPDCSPAPTWRPLAR